MSKIQIDHVISGERTRGWVHTHGLADHGLPELEVRNIPAFLAEDAARLLQHVADYMLDSGKTVRLGETMEVSPQSRFRFAKPEPIPDQGDHYEVERWLLVEVEESCSCCGKADDDVE